MKFYLSDTSCYTGRFLKFCLLVMSDSRCLCCHVTSRWDVDKPCFQDDCLGCETDVDKKPNWSLLPSLYFPLWDQAVMRWSLTCACGSSQGLSVTSSQWKEKMRKLDRNKSVKARLVIVPGDVGVWAQSKKMMWVNLGWSFYRCPGVKGTSFQTQSNPLLSFLSLVCGQS